MGLKKKIGSWALRLLSKKHRGSWQKMSAYPAPPDQDPEAGFSLNGLTEEKFELIMKYGKASNQLGKYVSKDFVELPYGIVRKDLPTLQKKDLLYDSIMLILSCQYDKVNLRGVSANDMMSFLLWIKRQQERIYKIEEHYLSSDPEPEMISAGVHKLNELGVLSTIHNLAGKDPLKHAAIEALPYYKIYEILKLEKIERDINKAYQVIMENKAKTKK